MKTAEEYVRTMVHDSRTFVSHVKQIQLDAMKEGMRRAAKVSREHLQGTASGWVNITQRGKTVSNAILDAAEQLTEKDL